MIRLNTCFNVIEAQKMKEKKVRVSKLKATVRDYIYIVICLAILGNVISKFDIKITPKGFEQAIASSYVPSELAPQIIEVEKKDIRSEKLQKFLESKDSPLAPHAGLIVSEADKYGLDWTKLVAISDMESKFGTRTKEGSHNAWGIGGSKLFYFDNWEQGIIYASKLLGTKYKEIENQGVKSIYCPSADNCNPEWAIIVTNTSNEILELEKD